MAVTLGGRAFVYLSESVVTRTDPVKTIVRVASELGLNPDPTVLDASWSQAAGSIRSQAARYNANTAQFKPQRHIQWLQRVIGEAVAPIHGSPGQLADLRRTLLKDLSGIKRYYVPPDVADFVSTLESNDVLWGIIANEDHLYQAVLKYLNLQPHAVVSARENFFKPLPSIFYRAWQRVPRDFRPNTWFVGSLAAPYDNIVDRHMRCVTYTDGGVSDLIHAGEKAKRSDHFRIAQLDELLPLLNITSPSIGDFDFAVDFAADFAANPRGEPESDSRKETLYSATPQSLPKMPPNPLYPMGPRDEGLGSLGPRFHDERVKVEKALSKSRQIIYLNKRR